MQSDEERIAAELAAFIRRVASPDVLATLDVTRNEPVYPEYVNDPDRFAREVLGITFWERQKEIAESVRDNKRTCVVAAHSVGKTVDAACLGLWWLSVHEHAKLVTVAQTHTQLNSLLWHAMRQYAKGAKKRIPGEIYDTPRWEFGSKQRLAFGLSPRKASEIDVVAMQGAHDEYLMVILEEAGGLSQYVWQAALSLVTGEKNRLLTIGNPIGESGPFYDASKSPNYKHIHISCFEHPNVIEGREIIPGAVSQGWVEECITEWCRPTDNPGPTSFEWKGQWYDPLPVFQSRVLGLFAAEQADQLIALLWVESAIARWQEATPVGERVLGMDIARHGSNETCLVFRIGDVIQWIKRRRGNDIAENVGWLISTIQETGAERAFVDDVGIGGGVVDVVRAQGYAVEGVNVQHPAHQRSKFANIHDEMWWTVREKLRVGDMALPDDSKVIADLTAMRHKGHDLQGRLMLEKKEDMMKRLGRSPDTGDALALSYADAGFIGSMAGDYADDLHTQSRWAMGEKAERETMGTEDWGLAADKRPSRWRVGRLPRRSW